MKKIIQTIATLIMTVLICSFEISAFAADIDLIGTVAGNTYTNPYLNFIIELDDVWEIHSDKEIAEIYDYEEKDNGREGMLNELEKTGGVYVLSAIRQDDDKSLLTLRLYVLDLKDGADAISEELYCEAVAKSDITGLFERTGLALSIQKEMIPIGGENHLYVYGEGGTDEFQMCEGIVLIKSGNYMMEITANAVVKGNAKERVDRDVIEKIVPLALTTETAKGNLIKGMTQSGEYSSPADDAIMLGFGEYRYNAGWWNVPVLEPESPILNCEKFTLCFRYDTVDPGSLGEQRVFVSINQNNSAWLDCGTIDVLQKGKIYRKEIVMDKPRPIGGIAVLSTNASEAAFSVTAWLEDFTFGD